MESDICNDYRKLLESLDNMTKDAVIDVNYLVLRFTACPQCLSELSNNCIKSFSNCNQGVKIRGRCLNIDHIYLKWLATGRERVLFMECPHYYDKHTHCYYMRGKATIHLGTNIKENIYDYLNVIIRMDISDRAKIKIIQRHTELHQ